jgi:hypothetical protein
MHLIISNAPQDENKATQLTRFLRKSGRDFALSFQDIDDHWVDLLDETLREVDTLIFLVSPHALRSIQCQWELKRAVELGKTILPLRIKTVSASDYQNIPLTLKEHLDRNHQLDLTLEFNQEKILEILDQIQELGIKLNPQDAPHLAPPSIDQLMQEAIHLGIEPTDGATSPKKKPCGRTVAVMVAIMTVILMASMPFL